MSSGFRWWLQDFKHVSSKTESPDNNAVNRWAKKLQKEPSGASGDYDECSEQPRLFNVWNELTQDPTARSIILDGITNEVLQQEESIGGIL